MVVCMLGLCCKAQGFLHGLGGRAASSAIGNERGDLVWSSKDFWHLQMAWTDALPMFHMHLCLEGSGFGMNFLAQCVACWRSDKDTAGFMGCCTWHHSLFAQFMTHDF